ncbi:MAG: diacylglycerol kinase family protein [Pseudomonadota bacterium]
MTPIRLFVNPKAGRGGALNSLPQVERTLRAVGVDIDTRFSRSAGDLEYQLRAGVREGCETLVVAGGDGSFHAAVNGLLDAGGSRIGLLPLGTGNDFAKSAGIPGDAATAARQLGERLRNGTTLGRFDAGRCNERYFHNGAGVGIDARVAQIAAGVRLPIGDLVYAWGIARCLIDGIATPSMQIRVDDTTIWDGPATLANIANGPWVGSQFLIAPDADPSDGHFDVVIADAVTRRRVMSLLPKLLKGRHVHEPEVSVNRGQSIRLSCEQPLIAHLDGELQAAATGFELQCLPGALHLL